MYTDQTNFINPVKLTPALILCCLCGKQIESNTYNCCFNCLTKKIDIAEGIPLKTTQHYCRQCDRYLNTNMKWYKCAPESKELLQICLSKINQLKFLTILETGWIFSDVSNKDLKIRIKIQKDVLNNVQMQKELTIVFEVVIVQCDDCRRSFTPHMYTCKVQVRQAALPKELKRNMLYLEQLILKHNAHLYCQSIDTFYEGVDFKFNDIKYGERFVNFLKGVMPLQINMGKELVSYNEQNNEYRYKTNYSIQIAPVNKDELCAISKKTCQKLGISPGMYLCWRVTTYIHLVNPLNMNRLDLLSAKYFDLRQEITTVLGRSSLKRYIVLDVERDFNNVIDLAKKAQELDSVVPSVASHSKYSHSSNKSKGRTGPTLNKDGYLKNPNKGFLYQKSEQGLSIYNSAWSQSTTKIMKRLQKMVHSWVTITPEDDMSKTYCVKSHLGNILREGDIVLGYDMHAFQMPDSLLEKTCYEPSDYQDVYLVKRHFERKKKQKFKLRRLNNDSMVDEDEVAFINELESDPELRSRINLYKESDLDTIKEVNNEDQDKDGLKKGKKMDDDDWEDVEEDDMEVKLCELVDDMDINLGVNVDSKNGDGKQ